MATKLEETIAKNIRFFRKKVGLRQYQLAEKCGLTKNAITLFETGKLRPSIESISKIAAALEIPEYLLLQPREENEKKRS